MKHYLMPSVVSQPYDLLAVLKIGKHGKGHRKRKIEELLSRFQVLPEVVNDDGHTRNRRDGGGLDLERGGRRG